MYKDPCLDHIDISSSNLIKLLLCYLSLFSISRILIFKDIEDEKDNRMSVYGNYSLTLSHITCFSSVQFSRSVVFDSCEPINHSTPGLPVHHQLLEFTQTHVRRVSDAIQPSLSSPSPPAPNPSQHQSLFRWVNSSHEVAKVLEFQL